MNQIKLISTDQTCQRDRLLICCITLYIVKNDMKKINKLTMNTLLAILKVDKYRHNLIWMRVKLAAGTGQIDLVNKSY